MSGVDITPQVGEMVIQVDSALCVGCGLCTADCPARNLRLESGTVSFHPQERCIGCYHCVAICPKAAVSPPQSERGQVEAVNVETDRLNPDHFLKALRARRSIRQFTIQKVDRAVWHQLLAAGRYTPTSGNRQATSYVVVQDTLEDLKPLAWKTLNQMADDALAGEETPSRVNLYAPTWKGLYQRWKDNPMDDGLFFQAPALLVIEAESLLDSSLAAGSIERMADALGLGCLYSGFLMNVLQRNPELAQMLGVHRTKTAICMLVGYPSVRYLRTVPRNPPRVQWK